MSSDPSSARPMQLPHAIHLDLARLSNAVAVKRIELENAQLREELAIRRVLDALGLSGQKVQIDLDAGLIHVLREAEATS